MILVEHQWSKGAEHDPAMIRIVVVHRRTWHHREPELLLPNCLNL